MGISNRIFITFICLGLSFNSFGVIFSEENLVHQTDEWWQEFVHDGPMVGSTYGKDAQDMPVNELSEGNEASSDRELLSESPHWFAKNTKLFVGIGIAFFGGYVFRAWRNPGGFSFQALLDLDRAVANGDMHTAKKLLGRSLTAQARIYLAAKNSIHCPICLTDINDCSQYQVTTEKCFHFICAPCKQECQRSGRDYSARYRCPVCRVR